MGPVAMLRPPPGISSQTQPDGRSAYSFFPFRLGQRGIAPLGARPLDEPRRQGDARGGRGGAAGRLRRGGRAARRARPDAGADRAGARREGRCPAGLA